MSLVSVIIFHVDICKKFYQLLVSFCFALHLENVLFLNAPKIIIDFWQGNCFGKLKCVEDGPIEHFFYDRFVEYKVAFGCHESVILTCKRLGLRRCCCSGHLS